MDVIKFQVQKLRYAYEHFCQIPQLLSNSKYRTNVVVYALKY